MPGEPLVGAVAEVHHRPLDAPVPAVRPGVRTHVIVANLRGRTDTDETMKAFARLSMISNVDIFKTHGGVRVVEVVSAVPPGALIEQRAARVPPLVRVDG